MRSNLILKEARRFEKLSTFDLEKILQSYKNAINIELTAGSKAVDNLYGTNPKAAGSRGLKALSDTFDKVKVLIDAIESVSAAPSINEMLTLIGQASFYSSPQNAGTGFERVTTVGGPASPAGVLLRIK